MTLAETHSLRGYDAVQLATALEIHVGGLTLGLPALTLISADEELNIAAQAEGLIVEEPNTHCTERPALASRCPTTLSASPLLASRRKPGARLTPSLGAIRPKRWRGRRSGALVRP